MLRFYLHLRALRTACTPLPSCLTACHLPQRGRLICPLNCNLKYRNDTERVGRGDLLRYLRTHWLAALAAR